jgi:polysaccharide deacetylase family protein (PEP-CTERM system associated)
MPYHILLTIDVEDWFQVENLREACPVTSWSSYELRVERNTHRILDLLDEVSRQRSAFREPQGPVEDPEQGRWEQGRRAGSGQQPTITDRRSAAGNRRSAEELMTDNFEQRKLRATFFVLGWIAERLPNLVREIKARGHEIGSHGYGHELCTKCSPNDLRKDLLGSKRLLEDIIGESVFGYRAASFSVSNEILKMIEDCGYLYDSSYNSFSMHGRYGKVSLDTNGTGIAHRIADNFMELPISNLPISSFPILGTLGNLAHFRHVCFPWGGGAYFRLMPTWVFRKGVDRILSEGDAYLFYMHPWEIDPEQPRVHDASRSLRLRHYVNLGKTEEKLSKMLRYFSRCRFMTCHEYLKKVFGQDE